MTFSHLIHKREGFVGREWFFLELENIFETDRGTTGVLITGAPGSGKSALMSQLICSRYSSLLVHQNVIGYHLCEYSEKGKRDGTRFVHNLVYQIAARFPGYSDYIIKNELIRMELDIFCHKDVTGCFFTSISGPLIELKPPTGLRYIVIDALDECFDSDKTSEIIEILSSKIPHLPKWLKFILTSRNLTMVTARIPRTVRRMSLFANDERNVKDIRLYVSRFISQNFFFIDRLLAYTGVIGVNWRNTGVEEYSLIHAAAAKGHKDVVELLIKNNVSVHEKNKNYLTTFHLAAGNGHIEVLQLLYKYGVKFDVISLHHAAAQNHSDVVEFLLRTVGIRDTCLQCTCKPEHLSKFSVEDVYLYFCETALHAAVSRRHMDIVKHLLVFGNESLECKHHSGKTVLMDAVERNDLEMVDLLLENGANIATKCGDIISKQGKSKLCSVSSMYRHDFLYTVYCKKDSCKCGNTAIHVSAQYGLWNLAEKLTSKEVFSLTDVENCNKESGLALAIAHGHTHFMHHINETYKK